MRAAVVGAGAWGTALADLLASNGHETMVWAFETDVATSINSRHENQRFLQGFTLAPSLRATNELPTALEGAEFLVYATPSHHLRRIAAEGEAFVERDAVLSVATKGIERGTLALMTSVVGDEVPGRPVVGLSGPSFASEVAARQPTAIVAASVRPDAARIAQDALSSRTFRVYTNDDVIGVELGGALKNVMAVATGIVEGVGLGNNSRAALITRGLHEMTRLGVALGRASHHVRRPRRNRRPRADVHWYAQPQSRARSRDRPRRDAGAGAGGQGDGRRRRRLHRQRIGARRTMRRRHADRSNGAPHSVRRTHGATSRSRAHGP